MWRRGVSCTSPSRPACRADKLILHGNNKSEEELATALEYGVGRIVVDSFDEIARLGRLLDAPSGRADRPAVLVRVTPGVEAHTHEFVRTGGEDSKFGFSVASGAAAQAVAALELLPSVELVGVHAHIGSQVFDVSSFEQAAEVLGRFFAPLGLPELVVGGGLGVPYVNGESAPTQAEWAAATRAACDRDGRRSVGPDHGRAGALHRRRGRHDALHGGDGEESARHTDLRQRRRRHERQPAARALRQRV